MKLSFHEMASAQICNIEFAPGCLCFRTTASPHQHVGWKNGSICFDDTCAAPSTASTGQVTVPSNQAEIHDQPVPSK